ncbi:hypothetical protein FRC06_004914, partial [Ceratobasidium sp. 370]
MSQLSPKNQAKAKAKMNQTRAEHMQPEVMVTKYGEELAKANKYLLGYCKVALLSNTHMNTTLHPGPNPRESVEETVANLTQEYKENGVLDMANPISIHINPSQLTPECLAAIKACQDPQKVNPGEAPPWLKAAFGVDFQLSALLDATSQQAIMGKCNKLGNNNYTAELMAGSHRAKAAIRYTKEFIDETRKAIKEGDMQGVLSMSIFCFPTDKSLPLPPLPLLPFPAGNMDEPSRIWVSTNQPTIFWLTTTGETAFMSMQAWHPEANKARAEGKSEEEAFAAGYKCMREMGSFHVGSSGHFLLEVLGQRTVHQVVEALCGFAPIVNHRISSDFAKQTLCRDKIGGVTCGITWMSVLKLRPLTHVKAKYLSSDLVIKTKQG